MKLLTTLGALLFSSLTFATTLHNVVVFGDSLSDNGNFYEFMKRQLPQSPPYFKGRFSNGPVWIEQLLATYYPQNKDAHLLDYAFGGAGVSEDGDEGALFTLQKEIDAYMLTHNDQASPDSLFVVWIGSNNYFGMPANVDQAVQDNNKGLVHGIERLVEKGAKHVMVVNLPDLGKTPAAIELNAVAELTASTNKHNAALNLNMQRLKQSYPQVQWIFFDINEAFDEVINKAAFYGFTNVTDSCYTALMSPEQPSILHMVASVKPQLHGDACDGHVFFDLVHPTELSHHFIAEKARRLLDAAGIKLQA